VHFFFSIILDDPSSQPRSSGARRKAGGAYRYSHLLMSSVYLFCRSRPHFPEGLWLLMVTTKELSTYQPVDVLSMGDGVLGALVMTG
jgi:hypothetical protein